MRDKIKNKEELEKIENLLLKENEKLKKINSLETELEKENFNNSKSLWKGTFVYLGWTFELYRYYE